MLASGTDLFRVGGLADALCAIVLALLAIELRLPEASYTTDAGLSADDLRLQVHHAICHTLLRPDVRGPLARFLR